MLPPPVLIEDEKERARPLEPVMQPPEWLTQALHDVLIGIPGVESAAVARCIPSGADEPERIVVVTVVSDSDAERTGRAMTVAFQEACERTKTNLDVLTIGPGEDHPCIQFPKVYVRSAPAVTKTHSRLH